MANPFWDSVKTLWPYAKTVSGAITATLTFCYAGVKAVIELIRWRNQRCDDKIQDFLDTNVEKANYILAGGGRKQWGVSKSIEDISSATGTGEKRVVSSLKRLKLKRLVSQEGEKWKADTPPVTST